MPLKYWLMKSWQSFKLLLNSVLWLNESEIEDGASGEILRPDILEPMNLSAAEAAENLNISRNLSSDFMRILIND